ncbi:T9SS type A sorting domain-containing protein [Flavobacterium sp. LaA7.5]|nr:T9SS type A sorting domain-containing protein [Flavobacterium salilacus subsp. altitudinum]
MKKHLLTGALILGSLFTANAQADCASAIAITADGTYTSAAITGTYGNSCWGGTQNQQQTPGPLMANWYSYVPSANGLLTITTDIEANPIASTDTRLSVFTGTCGALQCYNGSDDVDPSQAVQNFRTTLTVPVEAGVTYYIAWDNNWVSTGFDFEIALEASDCLSPNDLSIGDFTNIALNSASLTWDAAIGAPANYDVEVGAVGFTPGTGAGTAFSNDTNSVDLTDLSPSSNDPLAVYLRSNCGASQGAWVGPFPLYLAVASYAGTPYANGFDAEGLAGFTLGTGWIRSTDAAQQAQISHEASGGFLFSNTSTTAASDAWMFSRALSLEADQEVTLTFFTRLASGTNTVTASLDVTIGDAPSSDAQGSVVETINETVGATYVERTVTYTPTASGIYYFGFHNNSAATAAAASLILETVTITGATLDIPQVTTSNFAVYPNPANDVINITNADNALLNNVQIVDLNGRTVKSVKFDGATEAQINVSDLASGLYIMNIASDKGTVSKKIVKN